MALKSSLLIDINNRKGNKEFLLGKLNEGAKYGYKADPVQLTTEIKEVRHEGGHVVFTTKGRRSSKQIRSLFPKLTAAVQHQLGVRKNEDLVAIQSEVAHETLRSILLNEMPTPDHPTWF